MVSPNLNSEKISNNVLTPPLFEITQGAFDLASIAFGNNGIPSTTLLVGILDRLAIGPEGVYLKDRLTGDSWSLGFRVNYYLKHDRFTNGVIFSFVNQEGQSINHVSDEYNIFLKHGANQFSHSGFLVGYEWQSGEFVGTFRMQVNALGGFSYTHNSNCSADARCGFGGGADSYVAWNIQGIFPELSLRIGISF